MPYLLINDQLDVLKKELKTTRKEHLTRLLEQCRLYEDEVLPKEHPHTSITFMGMAAANLSLAYLLTEQDHYLQEAKRWIFTAVDYDVWGFGFLVDVDLSASWMLYGLGLSYDWLKEHLSEEERTKFLNKLVLQGNKIFDYGQDNLGHCWSTNYWQNHNWINYSGLLTTAYAIRSDYQGSEKWISEIRDNFQKVFEYLPEDGSNYEGTGYWRYAINFFLSAADYIRQDGGPNYFEAGFLKNSFDYRIYQSAPNWEENINFADVPGILPEAFLELIWFNPEIEPTSPESLPLTKYFPDLGLVVMRSSWDTDATHLSFKSSPPGGHKQWKLSWELDNKNDWKTRSLTHYHVDFNHFILIHNGASLAIDEGYNRTSKAEVHNLITVDGTGCVGEKIWQEGDLSDPQLFDLNCKGIHNVWRDVPEDAVAQVEAFSNDNGYTYVVGESSRMYYPEMALTRNARHIINSECGYFIFLDELESKLAHTYTWRMHSERYAKEVSESQFEIVNGAGALNVFTVFPKARVTKVDETLVEEIMTPQRPDDIRRISLKTLLIENPEKSKNAYFLNVLQPKDALQGGNAQDISIRSLECENSIGVEITSDKHIETFLFSDINNIAYGDVQVKAKWISILKDKAGNIVKTTRYEAK